MNAETKIEAETLHTAMAKAFSAIEAATKDSENPAFKQGGKAIRYADLASVIGAIKPALAANNLFFTQHPQPADHGVCIETFLHHAGGESMSLGTLYVPANKQDAQGFGSAITYARRYALQTAFGVPTEDDDGNAAAKASNNQEPAKPAREKKHSALQTKVRGFVHEMEGCGDWDEWVALRDSSETQALIAEVQENLPQWWLGGPDMPGEFVPLKRRIEILETNLANKIADYARA